MDEKTKNDVILGGWVVWSLIAGILAWYFFNGDIFKAIITGAVIAIISYQILSHRRSKKEFRKQQRLNLSLYQQTESLFSLYSIIKPRYPLPCMRDMAIGPDLALVLLSSILEHKPQLVVELGSGVSTLIVGYALEHNGGGRLISYDHDQKFVAVTSNHLNKHALDKCALVEHAPLQSIDLNNEKWEWYDIKHSEELVGVDMLIVDGPPRKKRTLSRFPALPFFYSRLNDGALIIVDDAKRPEEKAGIERWLKEYDDLQIEHINTEAGAVVLKKGVRE